MGEFWNSIRGDLENASDGAPHAAFGVQYDSNAAVVKEVQAAVNALGYQPALSVDGSYGPMTSDGVKWAQGLKGLTQDGVIGDQTLGALGITPPSGMSVSSVVGKVTGALADVMNEYSSLLSWAQNPNNAQLITQGRGVAPGFAATRASVVNSYVDWTKPFEGWVTWMYLDALGYVTTGMGNKIDPMADALSISWKRPDGSAASPSEVQAEWAAVDAHRTAAKGQPQPGMPGGGAQSGWSSLRISKADIQKLVAGMVHSNEKHLIASLPKFAQAPADAQMAVHSMSWAMGPGNFSPNAGRNYFKAFTEAFNAGDYKTAADNSHMQGVGIDMRNMANKLLLNNAAEVRAKGYNPDQLYYISGLSQLFGASSPMAVLGSILTHKKRTIGITAGVVAFVGLLFAAVFGVRAKPKKPPELSA